MTQISEVPETLAEYKKSTIHILKDFLGLKLNQEEKDKIQSCTTKTEVENYKWKIIHEVWGE